MINKKSENTFDVLFTVPYTVGCINDKEYQLNAKVSFTKEKDTWLISNYEDDAIYKVRY